MASNLVAVALQASNKTIIGALKVDSEVLENIHEQFIKIATRQDIRVHSFQEARGMLGVKGLSGKVRAMFRGCSFLFLFHLANASRRLDRGRLFVKTGPAGRAG